MKYCRKCGVAVRTNQAFCPLCASELVLELVPEPGEKTEAGEGGAANSLYPLPVEELKYNFVTRLFLFLSIVVISTCLLVNILYYSGILWSLVVVGAVQLFWAAVAYPLLAKRNLGQMVLVDVISACILLGIIQAVTRTQGWSLDYVIPFLFMAATTVITFIIMVRRMRLREYAMYQFITILFGLLPVISVVSGLVKTTWPSIFSALYSFLTFIGMLIFADKKYKNELIKRFHF